MPWGLLFGLIRHAAGKSQAVRGINTDFSFLGTDCGFWYYIWDLSQSWNVGVTPMLKGDSLRESGLNGILLESSGACVV